LADTGKEFRTTPALVVSSGHFIHDIFTAFLPPLLPLLIAKHGLSAILAGALVVFLRFPSAFSPLLGLVSDRVDFRPLAICAPSVTAVLMTLLGVAPVYGVVCLLLLMAGLSTAVFHVYGPVMIARAAGDKLGRGMSFWMTAGELARTVGPLVAVWAVSLWTIEGIYPVASLGLAASVFLWLTLERGQRKPVKIGAVRFRHVWQKMRGVMLPLSFIIFSRACVAATLVAFLPTYMVHRGASLFLGGASLSVLELAGAGGTFLGGSVSDRVGRKSVFLVGMPASAALLLALVYAPRWASFPLILLLGAMVFSVSPVIMAVVHDTCGKYRGAANGLYMGINFLISGGVTLAVGGLADWVGFNHAFVIAALLGLAGIPFVFMVQKNITRSVDEPAGSGDADDTKR
jgi:FSR family fosmidomycin resistance protein-like MFS transporter